jgi:predicted NBD/HSP70 family sugar kinase
MEEIPRRLRQFVKQLVTLVSESLGLINGLDPEVVVIGGEITKVWGVIEPIIVEQTKRNLLAPRSHRVAIRPSAFEVRPSLKGALTLIQNSLLSVPHMG